MALWFRYTLQFSSPIDNDQWDIITAEVLDAGAEGTWCEALDQELAADNDSSNPVLKEAIKAEVFFQIETVEASSTPVEIIREALDGLSGFPDFQISVEPVDEDGWVAMARPHYHANQVSDRFIVGPPEERFSFPRETDDQHYIAIEFGPAFGTGTHPTTQLCLELLEEMDAMPESVLDIGCGTGVLSFAACLLGAEIAVGMDCLAKAEGEFLQNAAHNKLQDRVEYLSGCTAEEARLGCLLAGVPLPELILCNMLSAEFDDFLEPLSHWKRPMILSGFLEAEQFTVQNRLTVAGWEIVETRMIRDWAAVMCQPLS